MHVNTVRLGIIEHRVYVWGMRKRAHPKPQAYRRTFIRQWREYRGLSQTDLENRMEKAPGEPLISRVSIGRIEKGQQPYSQPILEAMAQALECEAWELLEVDPTKEGEVIDLMRILRSLDRTQLGQVTKIVKAIA